MLAPLELLWAELPLQLAIGTVLTPIWLRHPRDHLPVHHLQPTGVELAGLRCLGHHPHHQERPILRGLAQEGILCKRLGNFQGPLLLIAHPYQLAVHPS